MSITIYEVTGDKVVIADATLKLSKEQVSARAHQLEPLKGGLHRLVGETHFKKGEQFGYDGELSKVLARSLEAVDKPDGKPDGKPKGSDD